MGRTEFSCRERSLVGPAVDLRVELIRRRRQRRNIGVLVRHLPQPQLLAHLPSVGSGHRPPTP